MIYLMKSKEFFKNSFDYILMRKLPVLILKGFLERREKEDNYLFPPFS